jgi:hypothetical protein
MTKQEIMQEIAVGIAASIRKELAARTEDGKVRMATLTTSLALHIAIEATATALEVDKQWFKQQCGVGQPLAYFV